MSTYPRRDFTPPRSTSSDQYQSHQNPADPYTNVNVDSYNSTWSNFPEKQDSMDALTRPTPVRRFSRQWWHITWDRQVVIGFLPRMVYVVLGLTLMAIWVGVIFAFANRSSKLETENALSDVQQKANIPNTSVDGLTFMKASLRGFDPDKGSLAVEWSIVIAHPENGTFSDYGIGDSYYPMGFWVDQVSVFDSNLTAFVSDGFTYFTMENATIPPRGVLGSHTWDTVGTDVDMDAAVENDIWKQPLFGYPWDEYSGNIQVSLNSIDFGEGQGFPGGGAFVPDGVTVDGNVLNWKITTDNSPLPSCDTAVSVEQQSCALQIAFNAKRSGAVRFIVILVVIVNWLSTLVIFLLTGEAVLLRRTHILEGTDMLSVCFAALFALPTVRSLLPGAPTQFGAIIDLVGIVPNVIIISLCTLVFAVARLQIRMKKSEQEQEQEKLRVA